ncbi:hypothetical protein SISSUDRAFT_1119595 [Sistotremastrum suecicum HHB10207 ss-3]|uniref:Fungal-type protein kinase domain-containing protein n=1 Tax=Sistotremastrum suecicum HHB10207 ss-3 TaxID=1314776 RepID=A0A166DFZ3_9AGAM|nr:hypothetical protein SISSUDRAFT_1119595 [Sistotremastrum suecicum HHB10207 ss-3]
MAAPSFLRYVTQYEMNQLQPWLGTAHEGSESEVNSIWNAALYQYFVDPSPKQRLIQPEATPFNSRSKIDLALADMEYSPDFLKTPFLVLFEGKSKAGDDWKHAIRQLFDYAVEVTKVQTQKTVWLIGGKGAEVKFWRFVYTDQEQMKAIKWDISKLDSQNPTFENQTGGPTYKLALNRIEIQKILTYIAGRIA